MSVWLRSCLFAAFQILITPPFAVIALLTFPFGPFTRYRIITCWTRLILWATAAICGIRYRVLGTANIPAGACVVLSKHQSAWETLAFQVIFPPQVYVIKRELLWIPFFGWGLAMLSPVAIDRAAGRRALKQMLAQGRERLTRGFWIIVFPEGTRIAPGLRADLVVLDASNVDLVGRSGDRITDTLLVCAGTQLIRNVMVGGHWIIRDGRHADEEAISARYREIARKLGQTQPRA